MYTQTVSWHYVMTLQIFSSHLLILQLLKSSFCFLVIVFIFLAHNQRMLNYWYYNYQSTTIQSATIPYSAYIYFRFPLSFLISLLRLYTSSFNKKWVLHKLLPWLSSKFFLPTPKLSYCRLLKLHRIFFLTSKKMGKVLSSFAVFQFILGVLY